MEDITIVLADKQPLTATQVVQAHERILAEGRAEGRAMERARIRQMALSCANDIARTLPSPEHNDRGIKALRDFAALLLEKP